MKKSNFLESFREKKNRFQSLLLDFFNLMSDFTALIDKEKNKNPDITNFKIIYPSIKISLIILSL